MSVQDLMLGLMWAVVVVPACVLLVAMAGVAVMLPGFRNGAEGNGQMGKWSNGQSGGVKTALQGQREGDYAGRRGGGCTGPCCGFDSRPRHLRLGSHERSVPHEVIDVMA